MSFDILIAILLLLAVAFLVYLLCRVFMGKWKSEYEKTAALLTTEQSKNQYLVEQQEQLVQEKDGLTLELTDANNAKNELAASLEDSQANIKQHLGTIQTLRPYENKFKQLELDYEDLYTNKYKQLQDDYDELLGQHQQTQENLNIHSQKVTDLQQKNTDLKQKRTDLQQQVATLQAVEANYNELLTQTQGMRTQNEELSAKNKELSTQHQELVEQNQRKLAHLHAELKEGQQKNKELTETLATKEQDVEQLQQQLTDWTDLTAQNQNLVQQINDLQVQTKEANEQSVTELADLQKSIAVLQTYNDRVNNDLKSNRQKSEQQEAELQQLRVANTSLLNQITQLEAEQSEQTVEEDWQKIIAQLKAKIKHITEYNHELSIALDDYRKGKTPSSDLTAAIDARSANAIAHRNQEIARYRATITDLKDKLTAEGQSKYNLAAELKSLKHKFTQLSETATRNASEHTEGTTETAPQLSVEIANLQQQLAEKTATIQKQTDKIGTLQQNISDLQATNQQLSSASADKTQDNSLTAAKEQIDSLNQQIQDLETANAQLLASAEHAGEFAEQIDQLQAKLNATEKALTQKDVLIEQQQQQLADGQNVTSQSQENWSDQLLEAQQQLAEKTVLVNQQAEQLVALQEQTNQQEIEQKQIAALRNQLAHLQQTIQAKEEVLTQQDTQLANLQQQLTDLTKNGTAQEGANQELTKLAEKLAKTEKQLAEQASVYQAQQAKVEELSKGKAQQGQLIDKLTGLKTKFEQSAHKLAEQMAVNEKLEAERTNLLQQIEAYKAKNNTNNQANSQAVKQPSGHGQADDLTRIKGIGRFIANKLNSIGITTFEQIANFTKEDIQRVTEATDSFPGRIERDDWIQQAQIFIKQQ